jgi:hypothetical protein
MFADQGSSSCFAGINLCFAVFPGLGSSFTSIEHRFASNKQLVSLGRCRQQGGPAEAETEENQAKEPGHGKVDRFLVLKLDAR